MQRVSIEEIELVEDSLMYYKGAPFTGVVYETGADGAVVGEFALKDGSREGLTKLWYPDGARLAERMYSGNVLHGVSVEWYRNGNERKRAVYRFGVQLESARRDEEGNIVTGRVSPAPDQNHNRLEALFSDLEDELEELA